MTANGLQNPIPVKPTKFFCTLALAIIALLPVQAQNNSDIYTVAYTPQSATTQEYNTNSTIASTNQTTVKPKTVFKAATDGPNAISVPTDNFDILFSPNPAKDYINISIRGQQVAKGLKIQLIEATGNVLIQEEVTQQYTSLPLFNYPAGLYFVRVGNSVFKVVKE